MTPLAPFSKKDTRGRVRLFYPDKGFTLIELSIVVLIIGILAGLVVPRYLRAVEQGRATEARQIFDQIRTAEEAYCAQFGFYTQNITGDLNINIPTPLGSCAPSHYFTYEVLAPCSPFDWCLFADRCNRGSGGGKFPDAPDLYEIYWYVDNQSTNATQHIWDPSKTISSTLLS